MIFFSPCDIPVAETMNAWRTMGGTHFFIMLSEVAGPTATAGLALMVSLALLVRRRYAILGGLAVALGGATSAWVVLKALIARPRPSVEFASFIEPGYAFPSGHATNAFALGVFAALLIWGHVPKGRLRIIACAFPVALAVFIAFGRVYLGVHYTSDVVAGAVLGTAFGVCGAWVARMLERRVAR